MLKPKHTILILFAMVVLRIIVMALLDQHTYWTFDEPWNTDTAKQVLVEKQFRRTKDSFTPISILNVYLGEKLLAVSPQLDRLSAYRVAGIALNQAAVPLLYILASQLGAASFTALFFSGMLAFEPNILGHSILASNVDGYIFTWFLLLAVCAFYWADKKNLERAALFGLVLGLAQGVKLTSAYAVPLCLFWMGYSLWPAAKKEKAQQLFCLLASSWLGLNIFYAFNKLGMPLGRVHFVSPPFIRLGHIFSWLPAPVPVDYLQGLDMCLNTDAEPRPVFIMNNYFMHGVWYYFFYVLFLKTPIPLLVTAMGGWFVTIKKKIPTLQQKFLVLFIVFFMFYFSVLFNGQVGLRYLFPIYGFILIGMIWFRWTKQTMIFASIWMALSLGYNWPNFIGYFNEFVPVKHHRWWHLGDSNLTWNQEWKDWPNFVQRNGLTGDQTGPVTLPLNVSFFEDAITVAGILRNRQQLELLRDHFQPIDSFWGVKLKYFISPENVLKEIPVSLSLTPKNAIPESDKPCGQGYVDESGISFQNLNAISFGLKPGKEHVFSASFRIEKPTTAFFEMNSQGQSNATVDDQPLFEISEPTPRLVAKTVSLSPGVYNFKIKYRQNYSDGFLSFRALQLAPEGSGQPIQACAP